MWAAPLVEKNRGPAPWLCGWVIVICNKNNVVEWISPAHDLMAMGIGFPDQMIVIRLFGCGRPKICRRDPLCPRLWSCDSIGAIHHPDDAVNPGWGGAIPLTFIDPNPALAD
jgi:hypothetical protein